MSDAPRISDPSPTRASGVCRICLTASNPTQLGQIDTAKDGSFAVFECSICNCRFTEYSYGAHLHLHADAGTIYNRLEGLAESASSHFDRADKGGLRSYLSVLPNNRFVIDTLDAAKGIKKLLEPGCSRGYLTSYFVLSGYDVTGVDISPVAIEAAVQRFGPHFEIFDEDAIIAAGPYDAIYHVGTVGCVPSPLMMTEFLLKQLRPGGLLVFNAPNLNAIRSKNEIWAPTSVPPDTTAIFSPGVWEWRFSDLAKVRVIEARESTREHIKRWLRYVTKGQGPRPPLMPPLADFGLFVTLERR